MILNLTALPHAESIQLHRKAVRIEVRNWKNLWILAAPDNLLNKVHAIAVTNLHNTLLYIAGDDMDNPVILSIGRVHSTDGHCPTRETTI